MNRRGFLSALAGALAIDPERALWAPGKKLISVPAPNVYVPRMYTMTISVPTVQVQGWLWKVSVQETALSRGVRLSLPAATHECGEGVSSILVEMQKAVREMHGPHATTLA